jgi:hypothetical protein
MFCLITKNSRGRPLTSYEVVVNLIASTTTKTGLIVRAALDTDKELWGHPYWDYGATTMLASAGPHLVARKLGRAVRTGFQDGT